MKYTIGEKIFFRINAFFLLMISFATLLPFMHVISKSFSEDVFVISGRVSFLPKGFNLAAYQYAFLNTPITVAFANTTFVTVVGTVLALLVTSMAAYPLSLVGLKGRKPLIYFFVITMLFSGGMIPSYILMRSLGLLNNLWALILPHTLNVFNLLLVKNFYEGLPDSIRESAMIDGANNFTIFSRIVFPMSKAIIATMAVFISVELWNSYFNVLLYMTQQSKYTLQLFLVNLVKMAQTTDGNTSEFIVPQATVQAASVVIGTVPILLIYPFMQKYFVKGVTLGSVKG